MNNEHNTEKQTQTETALAAESSDLLAQIDANEEQHQDAQFATEFLLRKLGWKHHSNFPDHRWRWEKEIKGKTYVTTSGAALSFEKAIAYMNEG